jgi:hypothetical protein
MEFGGKGHAVRKMWQVGLKGNKRRTNVFKDTVLLCVK